MRHVRLPALAGGDTQRGGTPTQRTERWGGVAVGLERVRAHNQGARTCTCKWVCVVGRRAACPIVDARTLDGDDALSPLWGWCCWWPWDHARLQGGQQTHTKGAAQVQQKVEAERQQGISAKGGEGRREEEQTTHTSLCSHCCFQRPQRPTQTPGQPWGGARWGVCCPCSTVHNSSHNP